MRHAFEVVILPWAYLENWGYHSRVITKVKQELRDRGIILRVRKHNRLSHQAEEYRLNPEILFNVYPETAFFYRDFKRASRDIFRPHQVIQVADHQVKACLKEILFYWHGGQALEVLLDPQVVPQEKRQTMWSLICNVPTSDQVRPHWKQSETTGRLSASRPPIQTIPKQFRRPGVISPPGDAVWEVDCVAQHPQICLALNGKSTIPDLWDVLEHESGTAKGFAKSVVNPFLAGQQRGAFLWNRRIEGSYVESDEEDYDRVIKAVKERGIEQPVAAYQLMLISSEILQAVLPLMHRGGVKMVLPLHDGVIITGNSRDVEATQEAFYRASYNVLGVALPVESKQLF